MSIPLFKLDWNILPPQYPEGEILLFEHSIIQVGLKHGRIVVYNRGIDTFWAFHYSSWIETFIVIDGTNTYSQLFEHSIIQVGLKQNDSIYKQKYLFLFEHSIIQVGLKLRCGRCLRWYKYLFEHSIIQVGLKHCCRSTCTGFERSFWAFHYSSWIETNGFRLQYGIHPQLFEHSIIQVGLKL